MASKVPNFARVGVIFTTDYVNSGIVNYIPELYNSCPKNSNEKINCTNYDDSTELARNTTFIPNKKNIKKLFWNCFK